MAFRKATKTASKARIALKGPSGSGKTVTSLLFAHALADGGPIGVIDSEHGSSEKYAGESIHGVTFDFDVCPLASYHPDRYIEAMHDAADDYAVLVIDSISHAWGGKDGVLEQVDQAAAKFGGNKFAGWSVGTPLHTRFIEEMLSVKPHLITTMRSKMGFAQDGKEIVKVGMQAVQRDGIEYEFDIVGEMSLDNTLMFEKSRCLAISGTQHQKPGPTICDPIKEWLGGISVEELIEADLADIRELLKDKALKADEKKKAEVWLNDEANHDRGKLAAFRQRTLAVIDAAADGEK